ncbi:MULTISPECIES: hypothetical protein [unclassified Spiroplasma]|uniref:hypothetical protein n=1 Tax=unclassified Spiroplasma TaxID=2637901 RepID=UPI00313EB785
MLWLIAFLVATILERRWNMINSPTAEEASLKFLEGAWTLVYNIFEFLFGFTPMAIFFWIMIVIGIALIMKQKY